MWIDQVLTERYKIFRALQLSSSRRGFSITAINIRLSSTERRQSFCTANSDPARRNKDGAPQLAAFSFHSPSALTSLARRLSGGTTMRISAAMVRCTGRLIAAIIPSRRILDCFHLRDVDDPFEDEAPQCFVACPQVQLCQGSQQQEPICPIHLGVPGSRE
jgi:hypothetical protein